MDSISRHISKGVMESISLFSKFSQVDIPIQQSYLYYGSSEGDNDPQVSDLFAHTTPITN